MSSVEQEIDSDLALLVSEGPAMREEYYSKMYIPLPKEVFSEEEIRNSNQQASELPPPAEAQVNLWLHWRDNRGALFSLLNDYYRPAVEFVRSAFGDDDSGLQELIAKVEYLERKL